MTPQRMLHWFFGVLLITSFVAATPAEARSRKSRKPRPAPAEQAWLESRSAIVLDARTGKALFERQPDVHMYPASTTKILTAIVAIEKGDLDDIVTIQPSDVEVPPSSIGLRPGERITLHDLVYGLLLRSGNDAAMAIARHVGDGNRSRFFDMMNDKASDIGCTGSHFSNPHGLPDATHYTTARDLGRIMVYAMKNDDFRAITSTQRYVSTSSQRTRVMLNKNRLLRMYPGTTGGKPGYTRAAQQTLVASAKRNDRELVVVCLHSVGRALWSDAAHLLDFGFNRLGLASNTTVAPPTALASLSAP
jgi:serine-type D-Ala-D-Ala carboxypeptidase (penicillin-binding protein 5/6)